MDWEAFIKTVYGAHIQWLFLMITVLCISSHTSYGADVHSTKVFILPIAPKMFNWTFSEKADDKQFSYRPSLLGAPDLPPWIQYVYSKAHRSGFVYGAPPLHHSNVTLEIVGVNYENYETRRRVINLNILTKKEPARHQVHLKVDNLAVEDMFESQHLERLLDIFRTDLWREAAHDLHVTFLSSAVRLGARLPLRPDEKEGVVLYLGSAANVSEALLQLQEEVRPLYRMRKSCPRDFKRTTVDRFFRQQNFEMDWCAFRLAGGDSDHPHLGHRSGIHHHDSAPEGTLHADKSVWFRPTRDEVPERSYVHEFLLSILVPMLVMILLAVLLSLILCFHHEGINKRNQEMPAVQMVRYAAVQRATSTLRSLSAQRDPGVPGAVGAAAGAATPRMSSERDSCLRPQPPPYGAGTIRGSAAGDF